MNFARDHRLPYISFGPGLRFVSINHILNVLSPFGVTKSQLRRWIREVLQVPVLRLSNQHEFVEWTSFQLSLRSLVAVGRPNVNVKKIRKDPSSPAIPRNLDWYHKTYPQAARELYLARKLNDIPAPESILNAFHAAVLRLKSCRYRFAHRLPDAYSSIQKEYTDKIENHLDAPLHEPNPFEVPEPPDGPAAVGSSGASGSVGAVGPSGSAGPPEVRSPEQPETTRLL